MLPPNFPNPPVQRPLVAPRFLEQYRKVAAGGAVRPPTAAPPPPNPAMAEAREVLADMQQLLGVLFQQQQQGTPECAAVRELTLELNEMMRQARRAPAGGGG